MVNDDKLIISLSLSIYTYIYIYIYIYIENMLYKLTIDDSHILKKEPKIGDIAKCTLIFRRQV